MKKTFVLEDLDCAHCAAKMEEAIRKLEGVNSVTVSYIAQKLVLDAEDARFDEILKEAVKICRKVEVIGILLLIVHSCSRLIISMFIFEFVSRFVGKATIQM